MKMKIIKTNNNKQLTDLLKLSLKIDPKYHKEINDLIKEGLSLEILFKLYKGKK